jgi:hypothetical protein
VQARRSDHWSYEEGEMVSAFQDQEFSGPGQQQGHDSVDLEEASRQLALAAHDIAVASSCIGLGDLDEAHTSVITARIAADAAEEILRVAITGQVITPQ